MKNLVHETLIEDGIEYEQTKTILRKGDGPRGLGLITFSDKMTSDVHYKTVLVLVSRVFG
jgi:hypothetical protein